MQLKAYPWQSAALIKWTVGGGVGQAIAPTVNCHADTCHGV